MDSIKTIWTLGVMSGTSLNGADMALIYTDGIDIKEFGPSQTFPYEEELRQKILSLSGKKEFPDSWKKELDEELTNFHASCIDEFLKDCKITPEIIGYHGHSLYHNSNEHLCIQAGNPKLLSKLTKIKVISGFHKADMSGGGQGNPMEAAYVNAITANFEKPLAFINIGGISSLIWIGSNGEMLGFDTGPGNAAINDWVYKHGGLHMDYNGKLAITGNIHPQILNSLMKHRFFGLYPPKAIDRNYFKDKLEHLEGLSLEDGAATVTTFVAEAIAYSIAMYLPEPPKQLIICGGAVNNPTLLRFLKIRLPHIEVKTGNEVGINCNAFSAAAYAFLAVRSLYHMPLSFPSVTGVKEPQLGGESYNVEDE